MPAFFCPHIFVSPSQNTNSALCCHVQILQPSNSLFDESKAPPSQSRFFFSLTSPTAQPEWLKVISDTEADIGSNLRWACAAAGKPRPMVRWLRNGEPLASQVGNRGSLPHHHPLLLAWPSYWLGQPGGLGMFCCFFPSQSHVGHRWVTCAASQRSGIPPNGDVILSLAPERPKIPPT